MIFFVWLVLIPLGRSRRTKKLMWFYATLKTAPASKVPWKITGKTRQCSRPRISLRDVRAGHAMYARYAIFCYGESVQVWDGLSGFWKEIWIWRGWSREVSVWVRVTRTRIRLPTLFCSHKLDLWSRTLFPFSLKAIDKMVGFGNFSRSIEWHCIYKMNTFCWRNSGSLTKCDWSTHNDFN